MTTRPLTRQTPAARQARATRALRCALLLGGAAALVLLGAAPAARAGDLPPPEVRPSRSALPTRTPTYRPTRTVQRAPLGKPSVPLGKPSVPLAGRGQTRHSTYVPPVGSSRSQASRSQASRSQASRSQASRRPGRVPVTTFRIAPAPAPTPRATTWRPRRVPVAPARTAALPTPRVQKVSPSYAQLARTRPHTMTARTRPQPTATHRRTLQRRRQLAPTPYRRAVRGKKSTSVPMAPGQNAPRTPTRRVLPLAVPPGCSADG